MTHDNLPSLFSNLSSGAILKMYHPIYSWSMIDGRWGMVVKPVKWFTPTWVLVTEKIHWEVHQPGWVVSHRTLVRHLWHVQVACGARHIFLSPSNGFGLECSVYLCARWIFWVRSLQNGDFCDWWWHVLSQNVKRFKVRTSVFLGHSACW